MDSISYMDIEVSSGGEKNKGKEKDQGTTRVS